MRNVAQIQMNWSPALYGLVATGIDRFNALINELAVDRDRDGFRLVCSKNSNHCASPLSRKWCTLPSNLERRSSNGLQPLVTTKFGRSCEQAPIVSSIPSKAHYA